MKTQRWCIPVSNIGWDESTGSKFLRRGTFPHVVLFICVIYIRLILRVAFLVLTERAVLRLSQIRKGPNVVGPWRVVQCVADGLKLATKTSLNLTPSSVKLYAFSPVLLTTLAITLISSVPIPIPLSSFSYNILALFLVVSLLTFPFILLRFTYRSAYSTTRAVRVVGLIMSYEILLLLLILFYKRSFGSWSWTLTVSSSISPSNTWSQLLLTPPLMILWLMELGRTPFDLAERESELVSGFNVEYGRFRFLFFFFSEILCLLSMSLMFSIIVFQPTSYATTTARILFFVLFSLVVRAALPRFRLIDTQNYVWFRLTPWVILVRSLITLISLT